MARDPVPFGGQGRERRDDDVQEDEGLRSGGETRLSLRDQGSRGR